MTDPADYAGAPAGNGIRADGALGAETRFQARAEGVLAHGSLRWRDQQLSDCARCRRQALADFPRRLNLQFRSRTDAALRRESASGRRVLPRSRAGCGQPRHFRQLQGKELSYNNIADADAALGMRQDLRAAGLRHRQACQSLRRGDGGNALDAYRKAFATDPTSAFGGIIAFNRELDAATAEAVAQQFVEVMIAPAVTGGPRPCSRQKANIRVLAVPLGPHGAIRST